MDLANNHRDSKKVKPCRNNCGRSIYWNNNENAYFEYDSERRHICPNWIPSTSQERLQQNGKIIDTINERLAEILLKIDRLDLKIDKLGAP